MTKTYAEKQKDKPQPVPVADKPDHQQPPRVQTDNRNRLKIGDAYEPAHAMEETPLVPQTRAEAGGHPPIALITYLVLVVVPFLASLAYFGFFATPQYIAEARFAVRSLSDSSPAHRQSLPGGARGLLSMNSMTQDAYVVASYIHSTEILRRLDQKIDIRSYFDGEGIDLLSRLSPDASIESLLDYWKQQVSVYVDGPSGLITLRVRAFTPKKARHLAQLVIGESEAAVNRLSAHARKDVIAGAKKEMADAEGRYRKALVNLNTYQNTSGVFDPSSKAGETGALLTQLMARKLQVDSRLFVLRQSDVDDSPRVRQLKDTEQSLANQIAGLRGKLASSSTESDNLSNSLKHFSELETERTLAQGLYEAASGNLSDARIQAMRKSVYVTVFDPPALPQESLYPRTFATPFLILLGLSITWAIGALVWASVEDHRL